MRAFTTTNADAILPSAAISQTDCGLLGFMYIPSTDRFARHSGDYSAEPSADNELLVANWLEKLLKHFGLRELDGSSERALSAMLEHCGEGKLAAFQNRALLLDLKRKIIRTAGARLDNAFVDMSPDVVDEADAEAVSLTVEGRKLEGLRYQGEVYRFTDSFLPCHRLQAFCLGQTLREQKTTFMITQSLERFAVWVNIRAFPHRHHLPHAHSSCDSDTK